MRLSAVVQLGHNLTRRRGKNYQDWHKIWEKCYRGAPLPKSKGPKPPKPEWPVSRNSIAYAKERLEREYGVMKCLASPYITKEQEAVFISCRGTAESQAAAARTEAAQRRMPGAVKEVTGVPGKDERRANVGNRLHRHLTVEESLDTLIRRRRFE